MLGATIGCYSIFPVRSLYFGTFFGTGEKAVSCRDKKDTKVLTVVCVCVCEISVWGQALPGCRPAAGVSTQKLLRSMESTNLICTRSQVPDEF